MDNIWMASIAIILIFVLGFAMWWETKRQQRRFWLQQRQWDREDRESQIKFEQQQIQQALEDLHKPLPPRVCDILFESKP